VFGCNRQWFEYDDQHVRACDARDVVSNAAYILFYVKREKNVSKGETKASER
jgi:ubiquitin C-terminal hydrolase